MKIYGLLEIDWGEGGIHLITTDPATLDKLIAELVSFAPNLVTKSPTTTLDTGEAYDIYLAGKDRKADMNRTAWFIFSRLCQSGWEPFSKWGTSYAFRKAEEN